MTEPDKRLCVLCRKRYVKQQAWKSKEEKEKCLTCLNIEHQVAIKKQELIALAIVAKDKGIQFNFSLELKTAGS